jgi:hypothetical protein
MKKLLIFFIFVFAGCASTTYKFGEPIPEKNNENSYLANTIVKISAVNPIETSVPQTAKNAIFVVKENFNAPVQNFSC